MAMNGASFHSPYPGAPSPWSQIAAAAEPPSSPPPPTAIVVESTTVNSVLVEESDNKVGNSVSNNKKPVWNRPSNGASSSVMGADSWPALSESVKGSVDASHLPQLQGSGGTLPSPPKPVKDNASMNNMVPTHQKSFRSSNSNLSSDGGQPPQFSAPQGSMAVTGSHNHDSLPKGHHPRPGFISNDHLHQQRNSFRNRNGGPHQRRDGGHHPNYGNRRDQGGNQDWNSHRNFNGRENYVSPRFVPRFRPPPLPNPAQFFAPPPPPPPMRPFGGSMGFPELPPQVVYVPPPPLDPIRGVPLMPSMPPNAMFYPPLDPQLHTKIVNQIDYYFSNQNLVRDTYLRRNMDDQGWVSINLIAGFKRVKYLTDNIQTVIDAVQTSSVVEVQGDKIRRRNDWRRWILSPVQSPDITSSQTVGQLAEQIESISLGSTNSAVAGGLDATQNRPLGDLNSQHQLSTSKGSGQVSDHSSTAKN